MGSFLERADVVQEATPGVQSQKKAIKNTHTEKKKEKPAPRSKDIRELFRNHVQNKRTNGRSL